MNRNDRELGMDRRITRRDFVNGVSVVAGSLLLPRWASAFSQDSPPEQASDYYPPTRTGMRGSHPGSFEVAHALHDRRAVDLSSAAHTGETYDLVVVGGGLSGLSAAYFFIKNVGRNTRVLVLDNHDDFGGHAKRNEFHYQGRELAINGGTLDIESPERYNEWAVQVLRDVGIDLDRFVGSNKKNQELYRSLGLRGSTFFDKETWGTDQLVVWTDAGYTAETVSKTPMSPQARKDLLRIYDKDQPDYLPGLRGDEKKARLARMSYKEFLLNFAKVDPHVYWLFQHFGEDYFCVGGDATPALFAWQMGQPGFAGMNLDPTSEGVLATLPGGQHGRQTSGRGDIHFPDGNATIARLLVRWLIPEAVPGTTMEDVGSARVNYGLLDRAGQAARIRLNSTVVNVKHDGDPWSAKEVVVSYNRGDTLYDVRARNVVMACWNMFIPYLIPDLPPKQREALAYGVKAPLVYTSVAVKNWSAWQRLGISYVVAPSMYHDFVALTEAVSLGDLRHPQTPEEPIVLHMTRVPTSPGRPRKEQHRIGRADLLATTFETFERNIREQLARTLVASGFDPARDILAITVNRWPHGYAYTYNSLFDPVEWVFTETNERPCVIAREPYGLVTIANSDAAASPHTDAAMLEAHRAVEEVLNIRAEPLLTRRRPKTA